MSDINKIIEAVAALWIFRWLRATVPLGGEPSFRWG